MLLGQSGSFGQEFKNDPFSLIRKTDVWGLVLAFKVTPPTHTSPTDALLLFPHLTSSLAPGLSHLFALK